MRTISTRAVALRAALIKDPAKLAACRDARRVPGGHRYGGRMNGIEVWRDNMPAGTILSTTPASSALSAPGQSQFITASLDPAPLLTGTNLLDSPDQRSGLAEQCLDHFPAGVRHGQRVLPVGGALRGGGEF